MAAIATRPIRHTCPSEPPWAFHTFIIQLTPAMPYTVLVHPWPQWHLLQHQHYWQHTHTLNKFSLPILGHPISSPLPLSALPPNVTTIMIHPHHSVQRLPHAPHAKSQKCGTLTCPEPLQLHLHPITQPFIIWPACPKHNTTDKYSLALLQ